MHRIRARQKAKAKAKAKVKCRNRASQQDQDFDKLAQAMDVLDLEHAFTKEEKEDTKTLEHVPHSPSRESTTCQNTIQVSASHWSTKTGTAPEVLDYPWYTDHLFLNPNLNPEIEPPPPPGKTIYPLQTASGWRVIVTPYDATWPEQFNKISAHLRNIFNSSIPPTPFRTIEHIGSTSVLGLAAKPNIDILVTFHNATDLAQAIEALGSETPTSPPFQRYIRVPNGGGIQGRESFKLYIHDPEEASHFYKANPERSIYLIDESDSNRAGQVHVRCYRSLRDTLRDPVNEDLMLEYARFKTELAEQVFENPLQYAGMKDGIVRKVLKRAGWTDVEVDEKEKFGERHYIPDELPY